MQVVVIETPELGDRSYLVHDGKTGFVVDPQRDIDRILSALAAAGVGLSHVFETHIHNDYVTGGFALAAATGARYVVAGADQVQFVRVPAGDGSQFQSGGLTVRALRTPGHTPNHLAYVVAEGGRQGAVFTGGSLLYGTVGRTDLISPELTEELTRSQFHSARRLLAELPGDARVMPTHGFGSFCASSGTAAGEGGDIAQERLHNLAATIGDETAFVSTVVSGLGPYPTYYRHMAPLNREGPSAYSGLTAPASVGPELIGQRIEEMAWVIDTRPRLAFAASHLIGTVSMELNESFTTYAGWLAPFDSPITLLADSPADLAQAQRNLARIGMDRVEGNSDGFQRLAGLHQVHSYPVTDFPGLQRSRADNAFILDVRQPDEWRAGHIREAHHVPLQELPRYLGELPQQTLWVHCGIGFRASVAASLLDRAGLQVVLVDDDFERAGRAGLPIVS
ncbi:MAG: rhodanese-like domain-containing protein [Candidatus Dormibacteria bacterium]